MSKPKHSKLGASQSNRWLKCLASVKLLQDKGQPNSASIKGTEFHDLADQMFYDYKLNPEDDEIITYVNRYRDLMQIDGTEFYSEMPIALPYCDYMYGTADAVYYDPKTGLLEVGDLKTGFMQVDAINNTQLLMYGVGAIHTLKEYYKMDKKPLKIDKLRLVIVQHDRVKIWYPTLEQVKQFTEELKEVAKKVNKPLTNKDYEAGSHCDFCPSVRNCKKTNTAVEKLEAVQGMELVKAKTAKLEDALQAIAMVTNLKKKIEEELISRKDLKKYEVKSSMGNASFKKDEKTNKILQKMVDKHGLDITNKPKVSVTKARTIYGKEVIDELTERVITGKKLQLTQEKIDIEKALLGE